jgi:Protein of unknown function (DUF993)
MMNAMIRLPEANETFHDYVLRGPSVFPVYKQAPRSRVAYAAAHVVCNPLLTSLSDPSTYVDWDATLAYRHHLWSCGLGVAEAMDTAQRGMGLNWSVTRELIQRSLAEARTIPGAQIACGAGTDHLGPLGLAQGGAGSAQGTTPTYTLGDVIAAYEEQCGFVEQNGGQIILMASRALAACAQSPDDYIHVYETILRQVSRPVIFHWLGDMFDPALHGYFGSENIDTAMEVCLTIIERNAHVIDGIKLSLLDHTRECAMRERLPATVRMYTGDDFHYPELILGDTQGYSHALLGIFDAIAPAASAALHALDANDLESYEAFFRPTVPLARHIFQAPTQYYKTGIVFLAYLNGHQAHFRMVGGLESARSILHLSELFRLADQAGLLNDPERAVARMRTVLAVAGCL